MMKIVAGMGSVDDYIDFIKAGADEIFVGYVPEKWQIRYGLKTPLNRREVCYYNVQIESESEMEILASIVKKYKYQVQVTIALNSLSYATEQYPLIAEIVGDCVQMGFFSFIVADFALILYLYQCGIGEDIDLHVSGEFGEINHLILGELERLGMNRLIFHRKVSMEDMKQIMCSGVDRQTDTKKEIFYEAFLLNEKCHFHGGFCNSLHCDEMEPICRLNYRVCKIESGQMQSEKDTNTDTQNWQGEEAMSGERLKFGGVGISGCALCQLWKMKQMGITHLKIVGRGAYSEDMIRDIKVVKKLLLLLEDNITEDEFIGTVKANYCNGNCYYL